MRITDIEVITFKSQTNNVSTKWGYGQWLEEPQPSTNAITKISTDEGVCGYNTGGMGGYFGGVFPSEVAAMIKDLLVGEDPLSREHLWNLMRDNHNFHESLIGNLDCALWDLAGRYAGMSVSQLMGKAREKVRAYASTFPNIGGPDDYAKFALECKAQGYTAFKVHAYIYWNPITNQPAPRRPAFPKQDIEVCEAVRDAVGDDMTLMLDPWGIYTLDESIYVGRELEKLGYYFLEHPMHEFRVEPYRRLCNELDIAVCAPEHATWMHYSRAEWSCRERRTSDGSTSTSAASPHAKRLSMFTKPSASHARCTADGSETQRSWARLPRRHASSTSAVSLDQSSITKPLLPSSTRLATRWMTKGTSSCRRAPVWEWTSTGTI